MNHIEEVVTVKEATSIDNNQLNEEFIRLPSDLSYFSNLYAEACDASARAKLLKEMAEAAVVQELRSTNDKINVDMVKALVTLDETVEASRRNLITAETNEVRLKGVCDAIRAKKDMLVSIGANIRAESEGSPLIRQQSRAMRESESDR
jgi:hypothetical protein